MSRTFCFVGLLPAMCGAFCVGCEAPQLGASRASSGWGKPQTPVRRIACLYELKPWLNLDQAGDRDPEGIEFKVFLDPGTGKGVLRDGVFSIQMFRISHNPEGRAERILVSDWHYPTKTFPVVRSRLLGEGYLVRLRWAEKDLAGNEIEISTRFQDPGGQTLVAGTKRFRVPKYPL